MRTWFAVAVWLPLAIATQSDDLRTYLVPGARASAVLTAGQSHTYRVEPVRGFRLELEQGNADFAIDALDRRGLLLRTIDGFAWREETATFPSGSGVRLLRLRRVDKERFAATFAVRVVDIPAWSETDDVRILAEDASTKARSLLKTMGPALADAVGTARHALALWRSVGDSNAILGACILLADSLNSSAGAFEEARGIYTESLSLSRELGDLRAEAECLNNRGISWWHESAFEPAVKDLQAGLDAWKKLPPMTGQGAALSNLGLLAWETGEYENALRFDSQALRLLRSLGNRNGEAFVVNNMALVEGALGQWPQSIQSFERAAAIFASFHDDLAAGRALGNSARMYLRIGNPTRAESNVRRGLALIEQAHDDRAKTENLNLWGEVCGATRRNDEALDHLREALNLSRKTGDQRAEANALANIGLVLLAASDRQQGIASLRDSLQIYRRIGTPASQASVLYHLALAQRDSGDLEGAYASAASAVAIAETLRGNVAAENLRISFLASTHDYYSAFIDISMRRGNPAEGWRIAERARARSLLDSIAHSSRSAREEQLIRQLNSESLKLMRGAPDSEDRRRRVDNLAAQIAGVEEQARKADARDDGLTGSPTVELSVLQHQLGADTGLIEYSVGEPGGYAWVIARDSISSFRLPTRREIESALQAVNILLRDNRQVVSLSSPAFRRATGALSQALILPALTSLKVKRLILVPDGSLELAPFELLPLSAGVNVIDSYEVSEAPSATVLVALMRRSQRRSPGSRKVALFGDPVFDAHDTRLQLQTRRAGTGSGFARLPFSRREVMSIASLRGENITELLDFDALKEVLVSGRLKDYSIIHLSTHGVLDPADPKGVDLVFSLIDRNGARKDGFLSADEASRLNLTADLIVLSACGTATGRQWQGEGMLSLTRAFLQAGASRVLATRWPVDDEASAALLVNFYRALWNSGATPAAALRTAQLAVRSELQWRSPFYWASFVLQGAG